MAPVTHCLGVDASEVEVVSVEEVTWRDGSRGCAQPGMAYTQALIDGSVRAEGVDLRVQTEFGDGFDNIGARHRSIITGETAGGELSISSFVLGRHRGVKLKRHDHLAGPEPGGDAVEIVAEALVDERDRAGSGDP